MKVEIKVPSIGESISEAIVSSILKASGSSVAADEEILELETDKVNQVLHAPQSGVITWTVSVNDKVKIGQVIGFVDTEASRAAPAPPSKAAPAPKEAAPSKIEGPGARHMTPEFLAGLSSQKPAAPPPPRPSASPPASPVVSEGKVTRKRMSGLRKVIAQRLVEVKNNTAMLTTFNEVDLSQVIAIRAKEQEDFQKRYGVKLGFMSFFVKAAVAALKAFPEVNSYLENEEIVTHLTYNIGVAVSTERGLMVPVIQNCDEITFGGVESAIEEFAKKARSGSIAIEDLKGGSFTITNGGRFGSLLSTPILNPPQSAILGMHSIVKRPVVVDDQIVIRPMMYLALSYDHRIIDGREAVLFLVAIKENLEDPARMLLEL